MKRDIEEINVEEDEQTKAKCMKISPPVEIHNISKRPCHEGHIQSSFHYYVESEVMPCIVKAADGKNATFFFVDDHRKSIDEDGYCPPKYMTLDGVIDILVNDYLENIGEDQHWELTDMGCTDGFKMETVYVFSKEQTAPVTEGTLRGQKMTRYAVPLTRISDSDSE